MPSMTMFVVFGRIVTVMTMPTVMMAVMVMFAMSFGRGTLAARFALPIRRAASTSSVPGAT